MEYTWRDMEEEVGDSTSIIVGLEASLKKWRQIQEVGEGPYRVEVPCGLCQVSINRLSLRRGRATIAHTLKCRSCFEALGSYVPEAEKATPCFVIQDDGDYILATLKVLESMLEGERAKRRL